jgi:hypothetical protein
MRPTILKTILCAAWLTVGAEHDFILADGGTLRFSERRGVRRISVFTSPTPLRVGQVDVSVLVQDAETGQPLLGVPIQVTVHSQQPPQMKTSTQASTDLATNKIMQAALLELSEPGRWHVEVSLTNEETPLVFEVEVAEPLPPWVELAPWIAWPLFAIVLFALEHWLVGKSDKPQRR